MTNCLAKYIQQYRFVPDEDRAWLDQYFEVITAREGDSLFEGGKVCSQLFFVCKGVIRIFSYSDKGVDVTHYFYRENQFCTILESFDKGTVAAPQIEACCDTTVLKISRGKLQEICERLPYLKAIIDEAMQSGLLEKIRVRNSYLGQEAETQYKLFIKQQPDIALRVPVKDIASFLGITPQSLSRIRKQIR
ncbi:MAG TPA: Crp/Fnr family transcriptional regulator [Mucilaginibacter sp.]|jgi:CRP-like cAMP-binding protein|nr:Crp/Fnr family transcriptional regulator [Mucilaginibacter sp.]